MLKLLVVLVLSLGVLDSAAGQNASVGGEWWRDTFIYQVYPRSFKDSNGDGIGDLNGTTSKLDHLADLNVSAVWLSPIYASPMVDFGYDISNFTAVDPIFGTMADFSRLVARAKVLKLKVILDFVPNHSSDKHSWFLRSVQKIKPYDEYYIWKDARMVNGTRQPPNNWLSNFQGSAWTWNDQRKQYYYHQFTVNQPDLNYRSSALQEEMKNVLRFWLNLGVDGFCVSAANYLVEDSRFLDEPKSNKAPFIAPTDPDSLNHIYTVDRDQSYDLIQSWRQILDATNGTKKLLITEAYTTPYFTMKFYQHGSNLPLNFHLLRSVHKSSGTLGFKGVLNGYFNELPANVSPNWVTGNHDNPRVGSRLYSTWMDHVNMMAGVLPGVGIINYGDEIGMVNRPMTWNETLDPAGLNVGPSRYRLKSRDPERTPFQWDANTSAGFSSNKTTWLPVHQNYKTLNLISQRFRTFSHFTITKKMIALKKFGVIRSGTTEAVVINFPCLAIIRRLDNQVAVLLMNLHKITARYDIAAYINVPDRMTVYAANSLANISVNISADLTDFSIGGFGSVVLVNF